MTRILLTGAGGMLGSDLVQVLSGYDLKAASRATLDITDASAVESAVSGVDVVVNAAAYTAVDDAESHRDAAFLINAEGPKNLARAAKKAGARLIHVSTDYVFDGSATTPSAEDNTRNPQSVYGQSKAAGEEALESEYPEGSIIVRTAWLYGQHGPNFPKTMLRLAQTHETVSVVTDQIGQPTWSMDLARWIKNLIDSPAQSGVFHGTNAGHTSWFDFAREVYSLAGLDPERITPTTSDHFERPAPRPAWSVLGHEAWDTAGLPTPRPWKDALIEAFPICFGDSK
jgi:dTDP-4-dehydrorhamnose reductase